MVDILSISLASVFLLVEVLFAKLLGLVLNRGNSARSSSPIDMHQVKSVLIVKLDEIGDNVFSTGFLREMKTNWPEIQITMIIKPEIKNLMESCPYVTSVLTFDRVANKLVRSVVLPVRAFLVGYKVLRSMKFDLAIVPRWGVDNQFSGFVAFFSGASRRITFSSKVNFRKHLLNFGFDWFYTHLIDDSTVRHEVEHNLDIVRYLGGTVNDDRNEIWLMGKDEEFAEQVLQAHHITLNTTLIGICPSAGHSKLKQWPLDNFVHLCLLLKDRFNCFFVIFGGPGEESLGESIQHHVGENAIDMTGKTTLRQMTALAKYCSVVISNDTGPLHLASAVGVPVIGIFGSSSPKRFGPWKGENRVVFLGFPCNPVFHRHHPDRCKRCVFGNPLCLHEISVERVAQEVESMISQHAVHANISQINLKQNES